MVGNAMFTAPEPFAVGTLLVVNPVPLTVTVKGAGVVPSVRRTVMLNVCTPFVGVPICDIEIVPSDVGPATVIVSVSGVYPATDAVAVSV